MQKIVLSAFFASFILLATAQDKVINDPHAQPRNVKDFHAISISNGIDLYLTQGIGESVAVSASSSEYRDKIITEVDGGVLKIYLEKTYANGFSWGSHKLKAYVSAKVLDQLNASGGSDVFFETVINSDKLGIGLSGGSDLKGAVKIHDLTLPQTGGSDVNISGSVVNLNVNASGGSDLDGYDLVTEVTAIHASGGSDAHITVNKELTADASGGSDIHYKGNGIVKDMHSSGSSSVSKKG